MNCEVTGKASEKDHLPQCQHQIQCVDCGRWLLRHRTRFPLGSKKMKLCVYCFKDKWVQIAEPLILDDDLRDLLLGFSWQESEKE